VDPLNPTGYAQVVYETFNGSSSGNRELNHSYVYGLELISQTRSYVANFQSATQKIYYAYDGHGSVRALTGPTGAITDTYEYDAFGNLIHSTGSTPNDYLFAGEQFDPDLNLYYNRARYLNVSIGRFWTMDTDEGDSSAPLSLHKYLYAGANPVNRHDPTGHDDLAEVGEAEAEGEIADSENAQELSEAAERQAYQQLAPEILIHSTSLSNAYSINAVGLTAGLLPQLNGDLLPTGSFFVFALNANRQFGLQDLIQSALAFAVGRFSGDLAYMIGKMPQPVWQGLIASQEVIPFTFGPPGAATAYECLPPSFPAIDEYNQGTWLIVPTFR
jgi:RHS repeat-associated protein